MEEALRVEPTCGFRVSTQQRDALDAVKRLLAAKARLATHSVLEEEDRKIVHKLGVSIMSGKGSGKDALCSWLILWFLCTWPRALVPCTAPTQHQLRDVLWKEISKWMRHSVMEHNRIGSGFRIDQWLTWQTDRVYFTENGGRDWFAVGRTANPKADAEEQMQTLAGFHEEHMMVIADEAASIPDPVFAQLEDTMTQPLNFAVLIFNPTRSQGFAIETQGKHRDRWMCLRWNSEDSELVTRESIEAKARKYGRDSNAFRITVLGLPPKADADTLIPWDWVMTAVDREMEPLEDDPVVIGVDVGRSGDPSVILVRQGPVVKSINELHEKDTEELAGHIMASIFDEEPAAVFVDVIGMGYGVADKLRHRTTANIIEVNVAERPSELDRFHKLRDELWWRAREMFETRAVSIPDDDTLISELTTPKLEAPEMGKVKVESKRRMKARGCPSPNKAEALVMTLYYEQHFLRRMPRLGHALRRRGSERPVGWRTV